MNDILMDTHILYWYVNQIDKKLSISIKQRLDDANNLYVSSASCFEMAWLSHKGRIELDMPYQTWFETIKNYTDIQFLDINPQIAHTAVVLSEHHKDPMDRLIIATALTYNLQIASVDRKFVLYDELKGKLINQ